MKQINILDELIVDNFAGGGGASTGIELALGRPVDIAINHDPDAILMHKTNHPYTEHYCESVWNIDPRKATKCRPVGLAWFSPDCKHFSKAKGSKPVDKNIRGLAWIVLKWAGTVKPRVIILENVEEFQTWGPVRKGKPVKSRQGETFQKWKEQLQALGYSIEHRELVAADYGAPTIRKRFFLIARCDGNPIIWPERTHAPRNSEEVRSGKCRPWRAAAEIIDWSIPCPSIFDTAEEIKEKYGIRAVRPLAKNTERRIARGIEKFVLQNKEPFIVQVNHKGEQFRGQSMEEPIPTITGKHGYGVVAPYLIQYHSEQSERVRGQELKDPIMTLDSSNRYGISAAFLTEYFQNGRPLDVNSPLHTATTKDREGVVLVKMQEIGNDLGHWPQVRELLNTHCRYDIAEDEILLLEINRMWYFISDIGLRMLTPRELYNANGFPPDYIIYHDYTGKAYGKTKQVARCGNAVPPPFAEALVRANLPEMCGRKVETMEELKEAMIG